MIKIGEMNIIFIDLQEDIPVVKSYGVDLSTVRIYWGMGDMVFTDLFEFNVYNFRDTFNDLDLEKKLLIITKGTEKYNKLNLLFKRFHDNNITKFHNNLFNYFKEFYEFMGIVKTDDEISHEINVMDYFYL